MCIELSIQCTQVRSECAGIACYYGLYPPGSLRTGLRDASRKMFLLYSVVIIIFINCTPFSEAVSDWFSVHHRKSSPSSFSPGRLCGRLCPSFVN